MNKFTKARLRQLHFKVAPIMILPLLLTLFSGTLFQIAELTGQADQFHWLMDLHKGEFGSLNLEIIYPFLNGLGLLVLCVTGIMMWLQTPQRRKQD
jgi:uncharacterized iron-regulated membrane protein